MDKNELKQVLLSASMLAAKDYQNEKSFESDRKDAKLCGKLLSYIVKAL